MAGEAKGEKDAEDRGFREGRLRFRALAERWEWIRWMVVGGWWMGDGGWWMMDDG
jgi:hypothetical protein